MSRTDARTDRRQKAAFFGRQTLELCNEIDHWFTQQSIPTVHRSKQRATIGLCWSELFVFPCKHKQCCSCLWRFWRLWRCRCHTFHPCRCCCCCCLQLVTMLLCEHPWSGSLPSRTACDYKLRCRILIYMPWFVCR